MQLFHSLIKVVIPLGVLFLLFIHLKPGLYLIQRRSLYLHGHAQIPLICGKSSLEEGKSRVELIHSLKNSDRLQSMRSKSKLCKQLYSTKPINTSGFTTQSMILTLLEHSFVTPVSTKYGYISLYVASKPHTKHWHVTKWYFQCQYTVKLRYVQLLKNTGCYWIIAKKVSSTLERVLSWISEREVLLINQTAPYSSCSSQKLFQV